MLFRFNQEVKERNGELSALLLKFDSDFDYYKNAMIKAELGDRQKLQ